MTTLHAEDEMPGGVREAVAEAGGLIVAMADTLPPGMAARLLEPADAPMLHAFRQRVLATLEDPDHYRVAGEVGDFVADHLGRCGLTVGLFTGGGLVAYGALGLPEPGAPNRGRDLPLPESELTRVVHMASAMVEPGLRGRGLHHWLIAWRLDLAERVGRRHALTTVSPRNHRSWAHLAAHGLYPKRLLDVGGGLVRFLVHRDATAAPAFDPADAELVPIEDLVHRPDLFTGGGQVWCRLGTGGRLYALCGRPRGVIPATAPAEPALA